MVDNSQDSYLVCALDPDLLSTAFKMRTSWHVTSGAPCSGKTTLINQLGRPGYHTTIETAREYFEIEMAKGRTSQEIRDAGIQPSRAFLICSRGLKMVCDRSRLCFSTAGCLVRSLLIAYWV